MIRTFKKLARRIIARLPYQLQKIIYLFYHWVYQNIKNAPQIFECPISTVNFNLTQEAEHLRLIGFLKIHNEAKSGNLLRVLKHMQKFCDDIVVCDCESTDNSVEIAKKFTSHILHEPNDFTRELFTKQKMLEYTLKLNPDWIIWLDADEVFDREGELGGIRKLCFYGEINNVDAFSFREYNLWKSTKTYRIDEMWGKVIKVNLWKNNGYLRFNVEEGLHRSQHPHGLKNIKPSSIKLIHYGYASPEAIEEKYQMYKKWGQKGYLLERLKDEKGIKLETFDIDWFPPSTFEVW